MGIWDKNKDKLPIAGLTTPNTRVDDAVDIVQNNPSGYTSKYGKLSEDALNEYLNREPFEFDLNGDALYQQYKDKYIQQGKMAMMDTMGQASALTGGYANSYAQSVGQQAYAAQLQNLNDAVPELYQMALDNYNQKGKDMLNKYALYSAEEQNDYDRWWKEKEYDRLYGEEEVEEEAPTYPDWYQEGANDYDNLHGYLGLEVGSGINRELVKAAREKTGIVGGDANDVIEAAVAMMNRELNYGSVDLSDTNILNNIKAMDSPAEIRAYVDSLERSGVLSPATADYYKMIYSVTSNGKTDEASVEEYLQVLVDGGLDEEVAYEMFKLWKDAQNKEG